MSLEDMPPGSLLGLEVIFLRRVGNVYHFGTILFTAWNEVPSAPALKHSFIPITQQARAEPIKVYCG
jgi:hypothetical protein